MGHRRGMPDQALDAAERFGERKDAGVLREPLGSLDRPELDRDHAAEPLHLPAGQLVLGAGWQPRIVDPLDLGMFREPLGDAATVGVVLPHAQRQRLRSEEHTSELQSQSNLVCRLLLEKKKDANYTVGAQT